MLRDVPSGSLVGHVSWHEPTAAGRILLDVRVKRCHNNNVKTRGCKALCQQQSPETHRETVTEIRVCKNRDDGLQTQEIEPNGRYYEGQHAISYLETLLLSWLQMAHGTTGSSSKSLGERDTAAPG